MDQQNEAAPSTTNLVGAYQVSPEPSAAAGQLAADVTESLPSS